MKNRKRSKEYKIKSRYCIEDQNLYICLSKTYIGINFVLALLFQTIYDLPINGNVDPDEFSLELLYLVKVNVIDTKST